MSARNAALPSSQEERRTSEPRRIIDLDEEEEEDEVRGRKRPTAHPRASV